MGIFTRNLFLICSIAIVLLSGCRKKQIPVTAQPTLFSNAEHSKKKILILSSSGGGGHTMAAQAVTSYLKDDYAVVTINLFHDVLQKLDALASLTRGSYTGEDLYNFFLQRGSAVCANTMVSYGKRMFRNRSVEVEALLEEYFLKEKPDAIISVIPTINGSLARVTQKLKIPCSVIGLDYDCESIGFLNGLNKKMRYDKFFFGIPFNEISIYEQVVRAGIQPEQVRVIGCPLRNAFLKPKNQKSMRLQLGLPLDKPVIMILMGATGSRAVYRYASRLHEIKHPVHAVICCGRGESLKKELEAMEFPEHVTVTILGFTQHIADYMAASNIIITKPGALSFNESLKMRVPMFFDKTHKVLAWERATINFVEKHNFGLAIHEMKHFGNIINKYLEKPDLLNTMRTNIANYELPDVEHTVRMLVREMFS